MTGHLKAKCRAPGGGVSEISILDINELGCLIHKGWMRIENGERLLLKMSGLEYKLAYVSWVEDEQAGLSFEEPLYGPVLQHLLSGMEQPHVA
jgi:hypothetical protein